MSWKKIDDIGVLLFLFIFERIATHVTTHLDCAHTEIDRVYFPWRYNLPSAFFRLRKIQIFYCYDTDQQQRHKTHVTNIEFIE